MIQLTDTLPQEAVLIGATHYKGEPSSCSVVFHLEDATNASYNLTLGTLFEALRFAEKEGVLEPLSAHWWARAGIGDGCQLQDEVRKSAGLPSDTR